MTINPTLKRALYFTYQALLCGLFPFCIFIALALSHGFTFGLPRYDFILLICLGLQWFMVASKLESVYELKMISLFHLLGLLLELYKTHMGSWSYPEFAYSKLGSVPLYSGFMYASVASFICQVWQRFGIRLVKWPRGYWIALFGIPIYGNFFTAHHLPDVRWLLTSGVAILFWKTRIRLQVTSHTYLLPVTLSFIWMGLVIWGAENLSTFLGAWKYPNQRDGWHPVDTSKISSWFLLFMISFMVVAQFKKDDRPSFT